MRRRSFIEWLEELQEATDEQIRQVVAEEARRLKRWFDEPPERKQLLRELRQAGSLVPVSGGDVTRPREVLVATSQGEALRKLVERSGKSITEIARRSDVAPSTLSRYLRHGFGRAPFPRPWRVISFLAWDLRLDESSVMRWLFTWSRRPPGEPANLDVSPREFEPLKPLAKNHVAYHEAGHALAAATLRVRFQGVAIGWNHNRSLGRLIDAKHGTPSRRLARRDAMVALAGETAEELVAGFNSYGGDGDWNYALNVLKAAGYSESRAEDLRESLSAAVARMVSQPAFGRATEELASLLVKEEAASSSVVRRIAANAGLR
jgi:transposase-like protein